MTAIADTFTLDPVRPPRYSMSFLRAADGCLRRAHYDRIEDASREDAIIGRVFHEVADAIGWATVMRGHDTPDYVEAERITHRVLSNPAEPNPLSKHVWAEVLYLVGRWLPGALFRPGERFEVTMRHEIRGRIISARIDRLWIDEEAREAHVGDYKTGRAEPPQRPEPTPQGDIYSWQVLNAHPWLDGVWFGAEHVRFMHPAMPFFYDRDAVAEIDAWLFDAVGRIDAAYAAGGELPATPGDACSQWGGCPVADSCPVKQWARPATAVQSHEDALEQFTALLVEEASVAARKKQIRGWVERAGVRAVQLDGQEIGYGTDAGESTDWKAIATAAAPDDETIAAHTRPRNPSFGRRKAK
jgi:hypothetical protein